MSNGTILWDFVLCFPWLRILILILRLTRIFLLNWIVRGPLKLISASNVVRIHAEGGSSLGPLADTRRAREASYQLDSFIPFIRRSKIKNVLDSSGKFSGGVPRVPPCPLLLLVTEEFLKESRSCSKKLLTVNAVAPAG
jgi:hypothetical protein